MFKKNQTVWCAIYGAGVVEEILHASEGVYPVVVRFKDTRLAAYAADGRFHNQGNVTLFPYPVEITKATIKPSIDWSHVSPEYNYLAQDENGQGYLCGKNPHRMNTAWCMETPYTRATPFTSYVPGTCDWKESLVKRPEGET